MPSILKTLTWPLAGLIATLAIAGAGGFLAVWLSNPSAAHRELTRAGCTFHEPCQVSLERKNGNTPYLIIDPLNEDGGKIEYAAPVLSDQMVDIGCDGGECYAWSEAATGDHLARIIIRNQYGTKRTILVP